MKTKSLIKLRISFLLKLNTDDLNQQIHYNKYLQKVILRTTEHLFSLNTSKSPLRETRISKGARKNAHGKNTLRKNAPGKSAPGKLPPGNKPPRKIARWKIAQSLKLVGRLDDQGSFVWVSTSQVT